MREEVKETKRLSQGKNGRKYDLPTGRSPNGPDVYRCELMFSAYCGSFSSKLLV